MPELSEIPKKTDFGESWRSFPAENSWKRQLSEAIRSVEDLWRRLRLPGEMPLEVNAASDAFPLVVTENFLERMEPGNVNDPLLRQVLPWGDEIKGEAKVLDAVGDLEARQAPGLLRKYHGRALFIASGMCAVNCRYCFRRHYAYQEEPRAMADWEPAFEAIANDESLAEVILSGGDPLVLTDHRLGEIVARLEEIPHVKRLRIHSRLPIVLPDRVNRPLVELMTATRLQAVMVVHANHPRELNDECLSALRRFVRHGIPTLNQAVLLRGVNDDAGVLAELCESLVNHGVLPYYLHQLDQVAGVGHFEVPVERGLELIAQLQNRLPGYAVPKYVREEAGEASKRPLSPLSQH